MRKLLQITSLSIIGIAVVLLAVVISTLSQPTATYAQQSDPSNPCSSCAPPPGPPVPTPIPGRVVLGCDICGCEPTPTPTPTPVPTLTTVDSCCFYIPDCACTGSTTVEPKSLSALPWPGRDYNAECIGPGEDLDDGWGW